MVISILKTQAKVRGRPSKSKLIVDLGTPEQQIKRKALLSGISIEQKTPLPLIKSKAVSGSFLHLLFCLGHINQRQLRIGLICQKTFHLAFKSMGIHSRVSSSSSRYKDIDYYENNDFESKEIEEKWKRLRKILCKIKQESFLKKEIINLILFEERQYHDQTPFISTRFINSLQSVLDEIGKMINKLGIKKLQIH